MELLDYLMGVSALHYLAMAVTVGTIVIAFYFQWFLCVVIILLQFIFTFDSLNAMWVNYVSVIPIITTVAFFGLSSFMLHSATKTNRPHVRRGIITTLILNIIFILGAIGGLSYAKEHYAKDMKELLSICKATNIEEVRKTGQKADFVKKCEEALKYESEHQAK